MHSQLSADSINKTQALALNIRINIIKMLGQAKSGHPAGALGMADFFAVLYSEVLNHRPKEPLWPHRDRVILSNGHICPVLYSTLALSGYFSEKKLDTLRQLNSPLQGHPHRGSLPGLENTGGPLGQGLSQAVGLAWALRFQNSNSHVYCFLSDGEHDEGQTWEAYLAGAKEKLKNLTVIIDRNHIQIDGQTEQVMPLDPLIDKLHSFGWTCLEIDGHDHKLIYQALLAGKNDLEPSVIVAKNTPGKGVSFMENKYEWHGKPPSEEEVLLALKELKNE